MLILEDVLGGLTKTLWMPNEMAPTGARLICPELETNVVFDASHMAVDHRRIQDTEAEYDFAELAEVVYATILGRLGLKTMIRFGRRELKIMGTDSVEQAEHLSLAYGSAVPPLPDAAEFEPQSAERVTVYEVPGEEKGIRIATQPWSKGGADEKPDARLSRPSRLLPRGQHDALIKRIRRRQKRKTDPDAGVLLDVDFYQIHPPNDAKIRSFLDEAQAGLDMTFRFIENRGRK